MDAVTGLLSAVTMDAIPRAYNFARDIFDRNASAERQAKLSVRSGQDLPFDKPIEVEAMCPGAREVFVYHLGREVARVAGDTGSVMLQPRQLGAGVVTLHLMAKFEETIVAGPSLTMRIEPPVE